ncbi:MAG: peptidoglycan DD-metalloendopeptidase family protein [Clostridia bacterium]|nr:peptidoglycan DD-metalloendopeptidase family protein [Clostridia bacterium]
MKNLLSFVLHLCDTVGAFTLDAVRFCVRGSKAFAGLVKIGFFKFLTLISKFYNNVVFASLKYVANKVSPFFNALQEMLEKSVRHARNNGFVSGVAKFSKEIKKCLNKNKKTVVRVVNYVAPAVAVVVILVAVNMLSNVTFAFEVKYSGETIGYISDEDVFNQASELVNKKVEGDVSEIATSPVYNITLVNADQLSDADKLSNAIIERSSDVLTKGYGLYVNNRFVTAATDKATLDNTLSSIKAEAEKKYSTKDVEFGATVDVKSGLYFNDQIRDAKSTKAVLTAETLPVITTVTETVDKDIAYKTVQTRDNTKYEGYSRVSVYGKKGLERSVVRRVFVNGVETETEVLSSEVIKKPVDEQVIIGTRVVSWISLNDNAKLSWPVAKVGYTYISSYYGAGRNHTGIDIAAPMGTQIYAAAAGTVISVEYTGSYGQHFVIDHGNGMKTLYAHCSRMDVTVGQKVEMGEGVAKVGSTGKSTGPHLHIEVIINGTKVNPAPYLGVK